MLVPFWRKAWNFCHQWSGITWLFQRCVIIPSLACFYLPEFLFCCQFYYRVPGAIFRHHVNQNFSSDHQYFNFIFGPLLLPPLSAMAAQRPCWRQGMVAETHAYLSAEIGIFPIQLQVITPPVKPVGTEPCVVISAINFLVCGVYLCYPPWQVSLLSSSPWHSAGATRLLCDAVYKEWQIKMTGLSYKIGI